MYGSGFRAIRYGEVYRIAGTCSMTVPLLDYSSSREGCNLEAAGSQIGTWSYRYKYMVDVARA